MNYLVALCGVAVAVSAAVYGSEDDSPGLVLLGLVLGCGAVLLAVRSAASRREVER